MADQVVIPGEYCTMTINGVAIAATRTFTLTVDRATYGNFVARGTSKWRTNYVADMGWTIDFDGLVATTDTSPTAEQFDDHFTDLTVAAGTVVAVVFTLRDNTTGATTFIYTGNGNFTSLTASAPQFGEATKSGSILGTGALEQTTGTVS